MSSEKCLNFKSQIYVDNYYFYLIYICKKYIRNARHKNVQYKIEYKRICFRSDQNCLVHFFPKIRSDPCILWFYFASVSHWLCWFVSKKYSISQIQDMADISLCKIGVLKKLEQVRRPNINSLYVQQLCLYVKEQKRPTKKYLIGLPMETLHKRLTDKEINNRLPYGLQYTLQGMQIMFSIYL